MTLQQTIEDWLRLQSKVSQQEQELEKQVELCDLLQVRLNQKDLDHRTLLQELNIFRLDSYLISADNPQVSQWFNKYPMRVRQELYKSAVALSQAFFQLIQQATSDPETRKKVSVELELRVKKTVEEIQVQRDKTTGEKKQPHAKFTPDEKRMKPFTSGTARKLPLPQVIQLAQSTYPDMTPERIQSALESLWVRENKKL